MNSRTLVRAAVTWGGALLIAVYLVTASLLQSRPVSWPPLLAVVGVVLLLGWFSRGVVDWFWRRHDDVAEQRIADAARRFGVQAAAIFSVGFGTFAVVQAPPQLRVRALVLFAALMLCFGFAMWLCAGYLWARIKNRLLAHRS